MNNNQKGFFSLPVVLVILAVLGSGIYFKLNSKTQITVPIPNPETVFCTQEAKLCPDGSYVGRTGPNCEFTECLTVPSGQVKEPVVSMVAVLDQKIFLGGGIYITPLEVLSDSRCPVDVTCIWAGEVVLKVKLEKDASSKEMEIKEGGTVNFGPGIISLIDVVPENNTKKSFADKDYKFTFKVSWKLD